MAGGAGILSNVMKGINTGSQIFDAAGKVASAAGLGRAQGRIDEAGLNQSQDQLRQRNAQLLEDALMNRQNLGLSQQQFLESAGQNRAAIDLNQRNFALNAPSTRAGQSVRGDLMANAQDATISGLRPTIQPPNISGGLRPSLFSDNTRALGSEMSRKALMDQMAGDKFEPMAPLPTFDKMPDPNIPDVTGLPQAGKLDTALTGIGTAGTIWDIIKDSGLLDRGEKKTTPNAVPDPRLNDLFGNVRF